MKKKGRGGRPPAPPGYTRTMAALVMAMRDRREGVKRKRRTERMGCSILRQRFVKGVKLPDGQKMVAVETIRDHCKTVRKDAAAYADALALLDIIRRRREILGWDCNPLFYIFEEVPPGYDIELVEDGPDGPTIKWVRQEEE